MRIIAFIPNSSEVVKKLERAREQTSHAPPLMLTDTVTSFRDFGATNFQHTDIPWCPKPQQPNVFERATEPREPGCHVSRFRVSSTAVILNFPAILWLRGISKSPIPVGFKPVTTPKNAAKVLNIFLHIFRFSFNFTEVRIKTTCFISYMMEAN